MPKGYSLHLGLNAVDPDHYGGWDGALRACENDARDMAKIARDLGYARTGLLLTREATTASFIETMKAYAAELEAGDLLLLSYAGHGGQVPDRDGDEEEDGLDETWLLFDRQLVDDELYGLFGGFAPGVRIAVISDSCHSGTVARNAKRGGPAVSEVADRLIRSANERPEVRAGRLKRFTGVRAAPRDVTFGTYARHRAGYRKVQEANAEAQARAAAGEIGASVLLISGCQDSQLSADGESNGLFTGMLEIVWDGGTFASGYAGLHDEIVSLMPPEQTPNLFQTGRGLPGFADERPFAV